MPVNRVKEYTISVTIGAVANIILNLFLIEAYGANGAALASAISEFIVTAVQLYFIRNTIRRRELFGNMWKYLLSGGLMFIVVYRVNSLVKMNFGNLIMQILVGTVVYMVGLVITKAPILDQAKEMILRRRS